MATPVKRSQAPRRQTSEIPKLSENLDPNLPSTPCRRSTKSPATNSARPKKSASKTPVRIPSSSPSPARDNSSVAPKRSSVTPLKSLDPEKCHREVARLKENTSKSEPAAVEDTEVTDSRARAMKQLLLEEAMSGLPESGAGRVTHMVNAFERLLSISKEPKGEDGGEAKRKVMNWALPGLQQPPKAKVSQNSCSPVLCSTDFPAVEGSEADSAEHSSVSKKDKRSSNGINGSDEGRRNRRNSTGFSGRRRIKKFKVKSLQPFKLRTEQRGRFKEEQFIKKVKEMLLEEERKRTPIAKGLPWTTDEPEVLIKPPIKEPTEPIELILHSDVRAVERADFDLHVAERMSFVEQIKLERERQKKLEEEEEIRRLRKELVPKAQPMPYFDRPFIPRKSAKPQTLPKEPRLLLHVHHPKEP
ncbi:Targeting protein for Xklp2 (TPX2) [Musa troglodytarum]|uniref:Targeting protein for Xklp2 (TPX2) n=1 Tax=Musa troglodytarum TaxID=320322 RepID=A0A9E7GAA9_9LILI|nr:Targeting protein for Xklp2 (TPX2) [Musa troglodytarum]